MKRIRRRIQGVSYQKNTFTESKAQSSMPKAGCKASQCRKQGAKPLNAKGWMQSLSMPKAGCKASHAKRQGEKTKADAPMLSISAIHAHADAQQFSHTCARRSSATQLHWCAHRCSAVLQGWCTPMLEGASLAFLSDSEMGVGEADALLAELLVDVLLGVEEDAPVVLTLAPEAYGEVD